MTTQPTATNEALATQLMNLIDAFTPDYIRPEYTSKKTAERHAAKLLTDITAFAHECAANLGFEDDPDDDGAYDAYLDRTDRALLNRGR